MLKIIPEIISGIIFKIIILLCFVCVLGEHVKAIEPSSEIPAKREFPLNKNLNPCDDFHKYVCSEVEASFKLREDRSYHSFAFSDSSERILEAKKKFFANIDSEKNLNEQGLQLKNTYLACMDEKSGVKQEKNRLISLNKELSGLKSLSQFVEWDLKRLQDGKSGWLQFASDSNKDNPLDHDLIFLVNLMNLPEHSYYENSELMKDYRNLIIDYFKIAFPGKKEKEYAQRADAIIDFEKEFVKIYPHPEVERQRWAEKRQEKQEDFEKKYAHIPWSLILKQTPKKLFITNPFPEALEFINKKMSSGNLEVIKDFYSFSLGRAFLDDSNPEYFNKGFQFNKKYLGGPNMRPKRDERCTKLVMRHFAKELDLILIPRLFSNFPEEKVRKVGAKIRESIINGMKKNIWLSPDARSKSILKIEKAKLYLVQPQNEKEWNFIPVRKYSDKNRIDNIQLLKKTLFEKELKELKEDVNLVAWAMGPLTVNAYYDPSANKFVLPMGILQYPFFVAEGDLIENLGAVGAVLGHELGHGIDDQGSKYDENGRLSQWMSLNDLKEFSERGKKMENQFSKIGHNGKLTLGENVADNVGLTFAFNAAFQNENNTENGSEENKKKFFISYARVWCYVARPKAEENQLKTDPHSLGWARINEQVKHQKAFAEAFHCKEGDKMVLPDSERIHIW